MINTANWKLSVVPVWKETEGPPGNTLKKMNGDFKGIIFKVYCTHTLNFSVSALGAVYTWIRG